MERIPPVNPMTPEEVLSKVQFHADHAIAHLRTLTDLIQSFKKKMKK